MRIAVCCSWMQIQSRYVHIDLLATPDTDIKQNQCNDLIAKQMQDHPNLASLGDGQDDSVAGGSATGTPRASAAPSGGTKLRLTLGNSAMNGSAPGSGTE